MEETNGTPQTPETPSHILFENEQGEVIMTTYDEYIAGEDGNKAEEVVPLEDDNNRNADNS